MLMKAKWKLEDISQMAIGQTSKISRNAWRLAMLSSHSNPGEGILVWVALTTSKGHVQNGKWFNLPCPSETEPDMPNNIPRKGHGECASKREAALHLSTVWGYQAREPPSFCGLKNSGIIVITIWNTQLKKKLARSQLQNGEQQSQLHKIC